MNIPSLPVDSIYKFSAFAGLATILFCLYTYNSLNETIQKRDNPRQTNEGSFGPKADANRT